METAIPKGSVQTMPVASVKPKKHTYSGWRTIAYGPSWINRCCPVTPATKLHCVPKVFSAIEENQTAPAARSTAMIGATRVMGGPSDGNGENNGRRHNHMIPTAANCKRIPILDRESWRARAQLGPFLPINIGR